MRLIFKRLITILFTLSYVFALFSCKNGNDNEHYHLFVEGKCECGEKDPTYVPSHVHEACPECGKCTAEECDGIASEKCVGHETKTPSTGGMACSMTSVRFISIVISITTLFSLVFRKRD